MKINLIPQNIVFGKSDQVMANNVFCTTFYHHTYDMAADQNKELGDFLERSISYLSQAAAALSPESSTNVVVSTAAPAAAAVAAAADFRRSFPGLHGIKPGELR